MKIFISIIVIIVCVSLFIFSYLLNKKTPKPEGCKELEEQCETCQINSCMQRKERKEQ